MESWVLISNCQTTGLAHSLQMLNPTLTVHPVGIDRYRADPGHYNAQFGDYDRVLAASEAETVAGADFSRARRFDRIPVIGFDAFHPDLTYLFDGDAVLNGPLDAYHSMIAFVAHSKGLTIAQTLPLFRGSFYEACGYLDRWVADRDHLIWYCGRFNLDVSRAVRRWGRGQSFMYSTNHPKIHVLQDVARLFLEREGYSADGLKLLPHDNLVNSSVFPVYPEIGEALGVAGSYYFKRCAHYTHIGLEQFVTESFAVYDRYAPGALAPRYKSLETLARVAALF